MTTDTWEIPADDEYQRPRLKMLNGTVEYTDCGIMCAYCGQCMGCLAKQWCLGRFSDPELQEERDEAFRCPVAVSHIGTRQTDGDQ